ncbi:MAG: M24 family metallopeptidase [Eubacteriales bacterium]|jgi:Xaa-Pro aminopeptidase
MNQAVQALQQALVEQSMDAMFITSFPNRYYVTGLHSTAGVALVTPNKAWFLVDFRYVEAAENTISGMEVEMCNKGQFARIAELMAENGVKRLGFEEESMSYAEYRRLAEAAPGVELCPFQSALEKLRQVKRPDELERIRQAQRIGEQAFGEILNYIRPGVTERQIRTELEYAMQKAGGEGLAFDTIVVSGVNSSMPHGMPTDKPVEPGDFVTMDFGCTWQGYCGDMTRTVAVGHVTDEMRQVYDTVLRAQQKALEGIRAKLTGHEIDALARDVIDAAGYAFCFGHSLGHSLGIEVHEKPSFSVGYGYGIPAGAVMSVEPGIYLPGQFGVRIEDLVVVREDGAENLNSSPKELIVL